MAYLSFHLTDCGAAYLAIINQYCGIRLNLYTLLNLATGAFLQGLTEAGQTLRYEARLVRTSLSKLDSYYSPWIARWQVIHYYM
ncbi:cysteine peptidase family C39 domain-containing protein [Nostoc flagelliforme]|uniref:cysteine peptidase family C39 domain-containing protein n=1 Tax=Nostoc flagelliforme TaxID=1306274 RepID=UPI0030D2595A